MLGIGFWYTEKVEYVSPYIQNLLFKYIEFVEKQHEWCLLQNQKRLKALDGKSMDSTPNLKIIIMLCAIKSFKSKQKLSEVTFVFKETREVGKYSTTCNWQTSKQGCFRTHSKSSLVSIILFLFSSSKSVWSYLKIKLISRSNCNLVI